MGGEGEEEHLVEEREEEMVAFTGRRKPVCRKGSGETRLQFWRSQRFGAGIPARSSSPGRRPLLHWRM
ncbi:hypothetical protein OPV22_016112 [Ensete ventricosum]|uniref:Uncharacterized protein n=1 Tax=Ensete ventricosum TaxID=4639 RepID=A0AAV8QXX4_ENSVE|nr:hypothetical protein OPV22_016112 [Ensete ventricosum]